MDTPMAEPNDQPAPPTGVTKTAPTARDGGFTPEVPRASDSQPIYRPLSILALSGFCLAVLYAVVIVAWAVVAFFSSKPMLQEPWMVIIPLGIAVLCGLGWLHVNRSEGTAAGAALGRWGLWLTAIAALGYWSYYGTTRYAVTSEADRFGRTFLEDLTHDEVHSAFRLALEPNQRRPNDAQLRADLEMRYNQPEGSGKGPLAMFEQMELVRVLRLYGPEATIESRGVSDFKNDGGRYWVTLNYHVSGVYGGFDVALLVQSAEGRKKQSEGRGWHVDPRNSAVLQDGREFTAEGQHLGRLTQDEKLRHQMGDWFDSMKVGRLDEAFLATKLPDKRRQLQQEFAYRRLRSAFEVDGGTLGSALPAAPLVRAALVSNNDLTRELYLPEEFRGFLNGDLVHVDEKVFWAPPGEAEEIIRQVKRGFLYPSRREELCRGLAPESVPVRLGKTEGDRFFFKDDFLLRISAPPLVIQGYAIWDCDAKEMAEGKITDWRLRSIELYRGRPPGGPPPGRGGPGGP
jgi:hypothetical protein